ncbi:MAG: sialate O-acetylesterase [Leptolyngbyaceae cyanobacterium bins.349]|nr:sialate O-acetylesterase [Leptolyngbyaceae cyanobacterium bins.349]
MKTKKLPFIVIALTVGTAVVFGILAWKGYGSQNILKRISQMSGTFSQSSERDEGETGVSDQHAGRLQLFILAGQSNMTGLGDPPQAETKTDSRIYTFSNDYRWRLAKEPVDDPRNQVDRVSEDQDAGFGPSVSFAKTLLEQNPNMAIGLIPCAKGGSSIAEWRRSLQDQTLYGSCLKRVRAASVMGKVVGFLYFQGEIDTVDPKEQPKKTLLPNQWASEFAMLVKNWRRDLASPELPVVFAQIGTNTEPDRFKNWAIVQAQQSQVQLPFTAMITTNDLALKDYVHFTTESYQVIGQRFAETYMRMQAVKSAGALSDKVE